jgi:predicted nucleic acid-binding Zn ribbon protein
MTGEAINLLEKVEKFINDFEPTSIGNVVVLSILVCALLIPLTGAIYSDSIEEIFMDEKRRGRNSFFKLLALLVIFIPSNFVLSIHGTFILFELLLGLIGIMVYFVYDRKEAGTRKYMENVGGLNAYYKGKKSGCLLFVIICLMPSMSILMHQRADNIPLFSCVVIVSIIEVSIMCISMPEFVNRSANDYFLDNGNKWFIYKRIDDDTIMCGDNTEQSKADKYITITYEELKKKELLHIQYKSLARSEISELRKKYKKNRASIKKAKISNTQSENVANPK